MSRTSGTIVVVEDEDAIAQAVAARLRSEGFAVQVAGNGPDGVALYERTRPDLMIVDVMLPGFDGLEVCRRIRRDSHTPVLMLTARAEETDIVVGLEVGADDYVTKPFSPRELVARVRALMRRATRSASADPVLCFDDVELDPSSRIVRRDGCEVHLTATEFDLAHWLLSHPGVVFSREQLLRTVWGYADGSGARTVDSHVQAVRRKLGPLFIRTVHGVGYALGPTRAPVAAKGTDATNSALDNGRSIATA